MNAIPTLSYEKGKLRIEQPNGGPMLFYRSDDFIDDEHRLEFILWVHRCLDFVIERSKAK